MTQVLAMPAGSQLSSAQAINEGVNGLAQVAGIVTSAGSARRAGVWQ